jgi:DNA polymerase-4
MPGGGGVCQALLVTSQYWVLHVDLDQFLAAVEILRRPELAGQPVIVGGKGDPTQRAVVATASYEARRHGVRSGMPMRTAAKRCPDAVFLPADNPHYEEVSEEVMAVLRDFPDVVVEVMGWDEAFVGAETADPEALAQDIRAAVLAKTRLHCSVGIGDNMLRAKLATEFAKPGSPEPGGGGGTFRLTAANWEEVMADRPTQALWGIGAKTARKLADRGLTTVRELAATDPAALAADLGPAMGPWYVQLGRGIGRARVEGTPWVPRSRGHETTFQENITDWADVRTEVAALARLVAADIDGEGRPAARVGVKVRFAPFSTYTRSKTLDAPTTDPDVLATAALDVLERFTSRRPVRLLGVKAEF